ncbi:MAG: hypothetical protein K9I02_03915 [Haliscomenobacter sp.]|nr:hypothetical protein [Haliscomenobacter sp.]
MNFTRDNILCEQVLFVDGMSGTGKSILCPILASLERVEKLMFHFDIENLSTMAQNEKISISDASVLIRLMADADLFNTMISRSVNLRPSDDSGIRNNPNGWKYIKRLFKSGGPEVITEIQENKPILHYMSHNLLQVSTPIFNTFGKGLTLLTMVRHPVYMTEHWFNYIEGVGNNPRDLTPSVGPGSLIPWFADAVTDYTSLPTMDKVIYGCEALIAMETKILAGLDQEQRKRVMLIPFESFVTDPYPWLETIAEMLGTKTTKKTHAILKKQKCPRKYINAGKGHKHYGFNKQTAQLSEVDDYERRIAFINEKASPEALIVLDRIVKDYEQKYTFPRKMPWEI